jgi:hypothetical protein
MDESRTAAIATAFAVIVIANCLFSNLCLNVLAAHEQQQRENGLWDFT